MSTKKNDFIKSIVVLFAICFAVALLMGLVNMITKDRIEAQNRLAKMNAIKTVLVGSTDEDLKELEVSGLADTVSECWEYRRDGALKGYAVILSVKGYDASNPMEVAVGFDAEGKILLVSVISCTGETAGIGQKVSEEAFLGQFTGATTTENVDTITGATKSSKPFISGVDDAIDAVRVLRGGNDQ